MSQDQNPFDEFEMLDVVDETHGEVSREEIPEASDDPRRHFKLTAHPFADNVNPEFFFRTEAHEEAFLANKQCIDDYISMGLTTALAGTGKTLLTQVLMQDLDPRNFQAVLLLAYPGMTRSALLRELAQEIGIADLPVRATAHTLISAIQTHIIDLYLKGRRLVMIIDEVHFLGADALHLLRTLSNIEVPERKLVTVLLFGEDSFLKKAKKPAFKSIFSRMFSRVQLRPLRRDEIVQYVKFRLLMAGARPGLFAEDVFELLEEMSGGVPREINRICHNALTRAAAAGDSQISSATLEQLRNRGRA